jgi:hypothetical protein
VFLSEKETAMTTFSARTAITIARYHGIDIRDGAWEKRTVLESLEQARGCGELAEYYFDSYMHQTARDIRIEGLRADEFHRNAYGSN